jgi:hypothetical protein
MTILEGTRRTRLVALVAVAASVFLSCETPAKPPVPAAPAPESEVDVALFLIGDAGVPAGALDPVLAALTRDVSRNPRLSLVVFLGDNIYMRGLPAETDPGRAESERRLQAQMEVVRAAGVRAIFVPGNHDWSKSGADGWDAIRRMGRYLAEKGGGSISMLPEGGCPGPEVVDQAGGVRLVFLDTEWWLREGPKPRHPDSSCLADSPEEVVASMADALGKRGARQVVVMAHHPLMSGGTHGGHFGWEHHLFPFRDAYRWLWVPCPVLGSAYPLARKAGIYAQDVSSPPYRRMRKDLESVFAKSPPLVYAAGHEHNLQVLSGHSARYVLVSGGGSFDHNTRVEPLRETLFARRASGYMRLDVLRSGRVRLGVIVVGDRGPNEAFSLWLDVP